MIEAILLSYYFMLVFYLAYIACILTIVIVVLNAIRQTLKTLALDIAQIINYFKTDEIKRKQMTSGFNISCQIARQRIQANRKLLQAGQAGLLATAWQAGTFDIEVEDAITKH